jgi:lysine/arginine/ornithine transport system substrate-binding protein
MKINFSTLATLALMALPVGAQATDQIRFGVNPTRPPFQSKLPDGKLVGFEIDLATELCTRIKKHCIWHESSFQALIPGLKAKKFDAVMATMSITSERLKQIAFTDKLFNTPVYLAVKKGSGLQATAKSLRGKRIGVLHGTIFEKYANKFWNPNGVNVVLYEDIELAFTDMVAGRLDGMVTDSLILKAFFKNKPGGEHYTFTQPEVYDADIFGRGAGIGLRQEDQALRLQFNQALKTIRQDGTYDKLAKKYFDFDVYGR